MQDVTILIARILLALVFIGSALAKLGSGYAGTQQYMESMHVAGALLPLVILTELGGGLAVLAGWLTRWAALALAGYTLLAALIFHLNFADPMQQINFMKNLAISGGLLALAMHGPGRLSLDAWVRRRAPASA